MFLDVSVSSKLFCEVSTMQALLTCSVQVLYQFYHYRQEDQRRERMRERSE